MAELQGPQSDTDGVRVGGFLIDKFICTPGKSEEDTGRIQITLSAPRDEINTGPLNLGDIIRAFNVHQESRQPVVLRVLARV